MIVPVIYPIFLLEIVLDFSIQKHFMQGVPLGGFLPVVWIKVADKLRNSNKWDSFFISLPERKAAKVCYLYLSGGCYVLFVLSVFIFSFLSCTESRNSIGIAKIWVPFAVAGT